MSRKKNRRLLALIASVGTQAEVARMAGLDKDTLGSWITGRNTPSIRSLERLAPVLGLTVAELLAMVRGESAAKAEVAR